MRNMDAMLITQPSQGPSPGAATEAAAKAPSSAGVEPLPILIAPHPLLKARARPVGPAD
jgi:hypothetical protein